ncbi:MAG: DUF3068 domain-containing protein [Gordonia sp. (in: high G+C Gram-positive bacteria)]
MSAPQPRISTRELIGPTAIFLGALLITVSLAIGPLVADGLRKVPLDLDQTRVSDGSDGTRLLDRCSLAGAHARVVEGTVQQRRRVLVVRPADSDIVTLQAGTALGVDKYLIDGKQVDPKDACAEPTLAATVDRVTLDRGTAQPHGESEIQYSDKQAAVPITDRQGYTYLLPFGFDAAGARYFDPVTRQTVPMRDAGDDVIGGRDVTHFVVDLPDTDLAAAQKDPRAVIEKPASWFGTFPGVRPDEKLVTTLHRRAKIDLYVDTVTGIVVDDRMQITETYRFADDVAARTPELRDYTLTNLQTTLSADRQTVREAADAASSRAWPVTVTSRVAPIAAGVLGLLLLAGGAVIILRQRRQPAEDETAATTAP